MAQFLMYIIIVFTFFGLTGCTTGVVAAGAGTTAYIANQEQTLTQQAKDFHLKANIEDAMLRNKIGYFKDAEVFVENGEVLIMGVVKTPYEKKKLETIAINQKYIKQVHNKILVDGNYHFTTYLNDALIANMIRTRIVAAKNTYLSKINVEVFKNRVYIFGTVGNKTQKAVAEYIARTGKGVQSVYSYIRVKKN